MSGRSRSGSRVAAASTASVSHTTYTYTRDRLGFDADREERRLSHYAGVQPYANGHTHAGNGGVVHSSSSNSNGHKHQQHEDMSGGIYEENLSKFKGLFPFRPPLILLLI